ncbi:MAG: non-hydrolyzing UDP-N-acetylglucosamine 2-epimerase [Schleiferiaceae bacterium]
MKVVTIIGARPQFIKSASVSKALKNAGIQEVTIHTGQHYDANMSAVFFDEMQLPKPLYRLECGGLERQEMLTKMQVELAPIFKKERPDYVLVYGDTNSTLAGARTANELNIPLIHVEAGLRSFNLEMPEEHNRVETDRRSKILFTPTEEAVQNLHNEGFQNKGIQIETIGDVMYDALLQFKSKAQWVAEMGDRLFFEKEFGLVTVHRFENVSNREKLSQLVDELNEVHATQLPLYMPLHPYTRNRLKEFGLQLNIHQSPPVGYLQMLWLLQECSVVLTDSGGLQKEAYFSEKPCITLREQTEWVELVTLGVNRLHVIGTDSLRHAIEDFRSAKLDYSWKGYGTGNAADKIARTILTA